MDLELNLAISKRTGVPIKDVLDLVQVYHMITRRAVKFKRTPRKLTIYTSRPLECIVRKKELFIYIRHSQKQRRLQGLPSSVPSVTKAYYTAIIRKIQWT